MAQPTLEQRRAKDAWEKCEDYKKDHVNLVKGLPAFIMNNGLMQTMAFLQEKDDAHKRVARDLRCWLHDSFDLPKGFQRCMEALFNAKPRKYQSVTTEALAWLKWMRQMAAARQIKRED